jgi:hypothetical protein
VGEISKIYKIKKKNTKLYPILNLFQKHTLAAFSNGGQGLAAIHKCSQPTPNHHCQCRPGSVQAQFKDLEFSIKHNMQKGPTAIGDGGQWSPFYALFLHN